MILTAVAAGQGAAPLFIDLNRTHATNPMWPGHARFHVVWQTLTQTMLAAAEVALIWWPGPGLTQRFYLAAMLTAAPMAAFLAAMSVRGLYRGTLHDPNGIAPVSVRVLGSDFKINMNLVMILVGAVLVVASAFLF
jgi:hypothetical protein